MTLGLLFVTFCLSAFNDIFIPPNPPMQQYEAAQTERDQVDLMIRIERLANDFEKTPEVEKERNGARLAVRAADLLCVCACFP